MSIKNKDKAKEVSGKQGSAAVKAEPSKIQSLIQYFEDAKLELGKVSWPTKQEVRVTSIAVLVLVIVMCIFLGLTDVMAAKFIEYLLTLRF